MKKDWTKMLTSQEVEDDEMDFIIRQCREEMNSGTVPVEVIHITKSELDVSAQKRKRESVYDESTEEDENPFTFKFSKSEEFSDTEIL
jgi:hypothetical protein